MDTQGMVTALKIFAFVAVISLIAVIMNLAGVDINKSANTLTPTPTPTITATPTPTDVSTKEDVDNLVKELDAAATDLDTLDKDMASLDGSLSTTDTDKQIDELNKLNK